MSTFISFEDVSNGIDGTMQLLNCIMELIIDVKDFILFFKALKVTYLSLPMP